LATGKLAIRTSAQKARARRQGTTCRVIPLPSGGIRTVEEAKRKLAQQREEEAKKNKAITLEENERRREEKTEKTRLAREEIKRKIKEDKAKGIKTPRSKEQRQA
jgi:microcompartment protein CcmL/EutN